MTATPADRRRLVIDRFEGELAVLETDQGGTLDLPRWMLPSSAREGDVVWVEADAGEEESRLHLRIDAEATRAARREAEERIARLKQRDPGGDIQL